MNIAYNMDCLAAMREMPDNIAAYDAGLDFVGYEIDKTYFDLQEQRFEKHTAQQNLFLM